MNRHWSRTANDDGTFRADEERAALYASVGIDASTPVIAYCRIGERSAHTWFVLCEEPGSALGGVARRSSGSGGRHDSGAFVETDIKVMVGGGSWRGPQRA